MKRWLYERWLPMWAKETLLRENRRLRRENRRLRRQLRERLCYIQGLHRGLDSRAFRRRFSEPGKPVENKGGRK